MFVCETDEDSGVTNPIKNPIPRNTMNKRNNSLPTLLLTLVSAGLLAFTGACSTEGIQVGQDTEGTTVMTCNDGIDNDNDGLSDCDDPDCAGSGQEGVPNSCSPTPTDVDAGPPPGDGAECADGLDNDGDGLIDESDPGCSGPDDPIEGPNPQQADCSDGLDNDNDGFIDFPDDPDCADANDVSEGDSNALAECSDGLDNDGDGFIDFPGDTDCTDATSISEGVSAP
tara:strand:+ start:66008 stop:66688 length:681 start_codon:yes stop_codon:yes gene_type:complete